MKFRNPFERIRDTKEAAQAAYVGGFLLIVTGGTGAVATVQLGSRLVNTLSPSMAKLLEPLFFIVGLAAALGGVTVVVAAFMLTRKRFVGKILLLLGSGVGLISFLVQIWGLVVAGRDPATDILKSATTVQGMAVLIVLYARLRA